MRQRRDTASLSLDSGQIDHSQRAKSGQLELAMKSVVPLVGSAMCSSGTNTCSGVRTCACKMVAVVDNDQSHFSDASSARLVNVIN